MSRLLGRHEVGVLVDDADLLEGKKVVLLRLPKGSIAQAQAAAGPADLARYGIQNMGGAGEHETVLLVLEAGTVAMVRRLLRDGESLDDALQAWFGAALERGEGEALGELGVAGHA